MDGLSPLGVGILFAVVIGAGLLTRSLFNRYLPSRTRRRKNDGPLSHDEQQISDAIKNDLERHRQEAFDHVNRNPPIG